MTDHPTTSVELTGELIPSESQPITLLDPKTSRAVRVLCWTLVVLVWVWLTVVAVVVAGFVAGFTRTFGL